MKDLKVAIWMITYNHENYIERAIESIMTQKTSFEYKLFIGEDCSKDKTRKVCERLKEKYPEKIELFLQNKNIGANLNGVFIHEKCIKSKVKFIALCEGDDYWTDPLKLQKQVDFLEENSEYVLCFHKVKILKKDGSITDDFITKVPDNHETIEDLANSSNYIHTPSVVFRNLIKKLPLEFVYSPMGDYFLYIMLAEHGKIKYIKETMAVYRYGVGILTEGSKVKGNKDIIMLFTIILSYLKNDSIKQIFIKKQLESINHLEDIINSKYKQSFVSNKLIFKIIKSLKEDCKTPKKILKKIKNRILKKNEV